MLESSIADRWRGLCRPIFVAVSLVLVAAVAGADDEIAELERQLVSLEGVERIEVLTQLSFANWSISPEQGLEYGREALELARRIGEERFEAVALNRIGVNYWAQGRYDQALENFRAALPLYERSGTARDLASTYNNIALIYDARGDYERALEFSLQSLAIDESLGSRDGIAISLNNIGDLYQSLERFDEAISYYLRAREIYQEIGNRRNLASVLNNLGSIYQALGEIDRALEFQQQSLVIFEDLDDRKGIADTLSFIAEIRGSQGDLESSLEYFSNSREIYEELGDRQGQVTSTIAVGRTYLRTGDLAAAVGSLEKALSGARELGAREYELASLELLYGAYRDQGQFELGLARLESFKTLNDELRAEEVSTSIAELQTRYEVDAKDIEIELLQKQQEIQLQLRNGVVIFALLLALILVLLWNRYRAKVASNRRIRDAHEALQRADEELRATQSKMVELEKEATERLMAGGFAHEMRNALGGANLVVQRALGIGEASGPDFVGEFRGLLAELYTLLEVAGDPLDPPTRERFDQVVRQLANHDQRLQEVLGIVHRANLRGLALTSEVMAYSKLGRERDDLVAVEIDRLIEEVVAAIASGAETSDQLQVRLSLRSEGACVSAREIHIYSVVQNLIFNARDAVVEKIRDQVDAAETAIEVSTGREAGRIVLEVRDHGVGIEPELTEKIFDPFFSTKPKTGTGLGLGVVKKIVALYGGSIKVDSELGRGSNFIVDWPTTEESPSRAGLGRAEESDPEGA